MSDIHTELVDYIQGLKDTINALQAENERLKKDLQQYQEKSIFRTLNEVDISADIKNKQNIIYLPWSKAWTVIKTYFPNASFTINKAKDGCIYHTDGKTAWVEVSLTINGVTQTESLAVMDFRNKSIPVDSITSTDAEKSIKRCLVKCAALHGLGLSLWTGEELSDAAREKIEQDLDDVKREILSVVSQKLEAGITKETIYKTISDIAGSKNPNAIKDINKAQKVLEAIKTLEVMQNAKSGNDSGKANNKS